MLKSPWGKPPLSLNDRVHWAKKAKLTAEMREVTGWLARAARIPKLEKISVTLIWYVKDERGRDTDNPVLTAKAVYDGLVDAGVVPDDTPKYMRKNEVEIIHDLVLSGVYIRIEEIASS